MLATSREPFDIPGEHTLPIPPLPVPGTDDRSAAGHDDAIALFTQRAAAASPGFALTEETLPHVIRLCRRLDGIPLAIELAAIRLRALPLAELANRLEHRFHMLDGGRRGAVPRHQTLQTAIGWSYDLCTPAEQELWARLSVFDGTFAVSAAEYVCTSGTGEDPDRGYSEIIDPLIGLVDKSVVLRDSTRGNCYRLPDTLREFGALRLAASSDETACRERHLSYYLAAARRFSGEGHGEERGDGQREQFRELCASHGNLLGALEYETSTARPAVLAAALLPYWLVSGQLE
jgi:non-specific serine/threonine protein kinase